MLSFLQAIFEFLKELLQHLHILKNNKAGDVIIRTAEIYDAMREVVMDEKLGVQRFLVIKAHNGGGDFRNDAMVYATVIHEEVRSPIHSVKSNYQSYPIDGYYNDMLKKIYLNDTLDVDVDTMVKDTVLGNIYQSEGVRFSKVYFLKHSKKGFWFCSIATADANNQMNTPEHKVALVKAVSKIKQRIG